MKIFQHISDEEDCLDAYLVLGLTIFEQATVQYKQANIGSNKALKKIYKRFFGRIIYKAKYYNCNGLFKREVSLFSIPIIGTQKLNGYKLYFILGIKLYSKPLKFLSDFKTEYIDKIDSQHDDIYILLHHLGDAFRMLTLIKEIIKEKQSKNPLIIVFDNSFEDMIKMMNIDIPYVNIQTKKPFKARMEKQFSTDIFWLGGFRIILLWNNWWSGTKYSKKRKSLPPEANHLNSIADTYNVTYDSSKMGKINILKDSEKYMISKSQQAGLNLDNFVFLAPEAFAFTTFSETFWKEIIKILQNTGYDVFINMVACRNIVRKDSYTNNKSKILTLYKVQNVKTFYLTIAEAYALACKSKIIISQRSGFSELLVQTKVPMCVLYSGNEKNNVEKWKIANSLLSSPFADCTKIHEINVAGMGLNESINDICKLMNLKPNRA